MNDSGAASRPWKDLIWIALGATLLFGLGLGARDLWNPNEPLYGEAVREMFAAGDWSLPRVNGEIFPEKPILYYWLALIASSLLGGVDEFSLRLPSAAAAGVSCLALYLLVLPYAGRGRARTAVIVFATLYGIWWGARTVQMDILLTASTLCALLFASRGLDHGMPVRFAGAAFGLCAGAGFLAKGPVGVICPVLVLLAYGLGDRRRLRRMVSWLPWAFGAFLVVACPWFVWLALRGDPAVLEEMLWRQNVVRFLEPWDHRQPWYYFGINFWIDTLPWSLLLPWAAGTAGAADRRLERFSWGWIVSLVLFFSLSSSKRSAYLMPAAPAVAVLVAGLFERWHRQGLDRARAAGLRITQSALAGFVVAAGIYLVVALSERYAQLATVGRWMGGWMIVAGAGWAVAVWMSPRRAGFAAGTIFAAGLYGIAATAVLPAADTYKSARAFGEAVQASVPETASLRSYKTWRWRASYIYYSDRLMPRIENADDLLAYWGTEDEVFLLVERGMWEEAQAILGPLDPHVHAEIGRNAVYLVSNRPAAVGSR